MIGIIIWSVVVSIASLALVKMTETFSRVVAYTKLDNGIGVEEMDNGNGEIECGEMPRDATTDESVSSSDDNMSIDHDDGETKEEEEEHTSSNGGRRRRRSIATATAYPS